MGGSIGAWCFLRVRVMRAGWRVLLRGGLGGCGEGVLGDKVGRVEVAGGVGGRGVCALCIGDGDIFIS